MCRGRAEEREVPVSREVLDRATERLDRVHHAPNRAAEHLAGILGVHPLRELGRPDDVGEQDGHDLALLAHLAAHRPIVLARTGRGSRKPREDDREPFLDTRNGRGG